MAYAEPEMIIADRGNAYDGFSSGIDAKDGVFTVTTKTEESYIHNKSSAGWLYPTKVFEQETGASSGSAGKSVIVYDRNTVLVGDPNSWYRERFGGSGVCVPASGRNMDQTRDNCSSESVAARRIRFSHGIGRQNTRCKRSTLRQRRCGVHIYPHKRSMGQSVSYYSSGHKTGSEFWGQCFSQRAPHRDRRSERR